MVIRPDGAVYFEKNSGLAIEFSGTPQLMKVTIHATDGYSDRRESYWLERSEVKKLRAWMERLCDPDPNRVAVVSPTGAMRTVAEDDHYEF